MCHLLEGQKAEEGLSIHYQLQGMLKKWFYLSISSIASKDADIHVVCHLENEASMSNNKARCTTASCSDRQLKYEPVQSITKIYNYSSVTVNISIIKVSLRIPRKGNVGSCLFLSYLPGLVFCISG